MPPSDAAGPRGPVGVPSPNRRHGAAGEVGDDNATADGITAALAERDWFAGERDAAITEQYRLMQERDAALAEGRRLAEQRDRLAAELQAALSTADERVRAGGRVEAASQDVA